jgi:hypothetical protein
MSLEYYELLLRFKIWQLEEKEYVFKYILNATSNCAFLFLTLMSLNDQLFNTLMPAEKARFWKRYSLAVGLSTDEFVWNFS